MAVAGGSQSVEYATMVECFEALVLGISQDPLAVANKLFSVRLASQNLVDRMLLQPRENRDKATEIVSLVMKKVEGSPDTLEVFMSILADLPSLDYLVGSLHEKYECNKNEVRCVKGVIGMHTSGPKKVAALDRWLHYTVTSIEQPEVAQVIYK